MVPQIGITTCFNIHFLREYIEILIYSLQNEQFYEFWTGEIIEISIISLPSLVILMPVR